MWATYHIVCSNDIHRLVRFTWADWCLSLFKFIATTFFALFYVQSVSAHEFVATIIKINDGDTLTALVNNETTKIRLLDIDCYETSKNPRAIWQSEYYHLSVGQVMQKEEYSKQRLKDLLSKRKDLKLKWSRRDRYKRILGRVYLDDRNINDYMLTNCGCEKYVERKK